MAAPEAPQPMACPECGQHTVVIDMEAHHNELPVYAIDGGGAWLGPWNPADEEWETNGDVGCTNCSWTESTIWDYELGTP